MFAAASNATGREMRVADAAVDLRTVDDGATGLVELSADVGGLAAADGDRLVVTEPFASGFEPDRRFTVRGPAGYELAGASPAADDRATDAATWAGGTDLAGFEATFAPTGGDGDGGTSGDGTAGDGDGGSGAAAPGFGAPLAVLATLALALYAVRRRES